jgi:hypothetical protein
MMRTVPAFRASLSMVAACALLLQGCAETASSAPPGYSAAADDPCQAERKTLQARNDYFTASILTGAAVGGAAAGLATGSPIRALLAAAAGAGAGAVGGYYASKKENLASKARLAEAIHGDLSREIQEVDTTTANFLTLAQCRFEAARGIKTELEAQRVTREVAAGRLGRQRALFDEDIAFADSLGAKMTQRGGEFEFASAELLKDDPASQQELERRRAEQVRLEADIAPAAGTPAPSAPTPAVAVVPAPRARLASVQPAQRVGSPASPPNDVPGVAQLTESNQVKRKAFGAQVAEAKVAATSSFDLDAKITGAPVAITVG